MPKRKLPTARVLATAAVILAAFVSLIHVPRLGSELNPNPAASFNSGHSADLQREKDAEREERDDVTGGPRANSAPVDSHSDREPVRLDVDDPDQLRETQADRAKMAADRADAAEEQVVLVPDDPDEVQEEKEAEREQQRQEMNDSFADQRDIQVVSGIGSDIDSRRGSNDGSTKEKEGPTCFFYDRPPRTGSTTISRAFNQCLKTHNYVQPQGGPRDKRPYHLANLLKLKADFIGIYGRHLYINARDVAGLRQKCGKLMYVTSSKPMRERIWSAAKYKLTGGGNASLTTELKLRAIEIAKKNKRAERYLEAYPYLSADETGLEMREEEKLIPDYVIRAKKMSEDLGRLLTALDCPNDFDSLNMHQADVKSTAFLDEIGLEKGDATYARLTKLAEEINEKGLLKVKAFK